MINKLHNLLTIAILFLTPTIIFSQAPNLGTSANFVLFSADGAVTNSGITHLTGNVGTNNGSSTGFGNVNGSMHDGTTASIAAAADLLLAYNQLDAAIPNSFPAALLGNGQILTEGVHSINSAATINLELILDGDNDPNAVFIFQINGSLSTFANAKVNLINGAQACNVFWKVEGLVDLAAGTTMRGTIIANQAGINLNTGDTLEGRAMSTTGAITVDGILGYKPIGCGSAELTGPAAPVFGEVGCYGIFSSDGPVVNQGISNIIGDVGANVGLTTGFNPLLVSGNIHPSPDGSTATAAADLLVIYNYLNAVQPDIELLYPAQFGGNLELTPHTYIMNGATALTDTVYLNAQDNADAVFLIKIYGAFTAHTYSKVVLKNGAQAKNIFWMVNGAVDINDYAIINGTIISQGAVNLFTGADLIGRILTGVGAIETNTVDAAADIIPANCQTVVGGTVSLNELNAQTSASLYPNPFSNTLTVSIAKTELDNYFIQVYNTLGKEIINTELRNETTILNTENLPAGVYFYKISSNNNLIESGKLIAQ